MPSPESPTEMKRDRSPKRQKLSGEPSRSLEDLAERVRQQHPTPSSTGASHNYGRPIRPLIHVPSQGPPTPLRISTDESVLIRVRYPVLMLKFVLTVYHSEPNHRPPRSPLLLTSPAHGTALRRHRHLTRTRCRLLRARPATSSRRRRQRASIPSFRVSRPQRCKRHSRAGGTRSFALIRNFFIFSTGDVTDGMHIGCGRLRRSLIFCASPSPPDLFPLNLCLIQIHRQPDRTVLH